MERLTDFLRPGTIYFRKKAYDPQTVMAGIESVARRLHDTLVSDSPFVYLFAINHIKTVFSYFGIIKAGRICVIMDPKIGPLELAEKLQDTPPAACIRIDRATETFDFDKEIEVRDPPWKDDGEEDLSDVCTMIYTAAEDGFAKAVMLTHENMLANARGVTDWDEVSKSTISCAFLSFNHLFALQVGAIAPFLIDGGILIDETDNWKTLSSLAENIFTIGVTNFYSVPISFYLLSKVIGIQKKIDSVEYFVCGGYKLSESIYQRFLKLSDREIHEGYGLSEASPICSCHKRNAFINIKSVGTSFPCCEIKIKQNGTFNVPFNQEGEICIRGANVMKGYYHYPQTTQNILTEGWLHTGDLGYIDNSGFIFLTGLKKKMINYAGKKVYPAEVERLILSNRKNVLNVEVFGENDRSLGQSVRAKIHLKDNSLHAQNELMAWCRRSITEYKIPSKIEFN
jgi:long-chain acyl-CoA synthetase